MPFLKSTRFYPSVIFLSIVAISVSAQTHFTFTSQTGNNMTVIVQTAINPAINGQPLASGDEIGVFTPAGVCAGARIWDSIHNRSITVWGDNDRTPITDGMITGDTLSYRIWDSSLALEMPAAVTYDTTSPATAEAKYVINGISVCATLLAPPLPVPPVLIAPGDTITADSTFFVWSKGSLLVNRYALEIFDDSGRIIFGDSSITDTTAMYRGLTNGKTYEWRVKSHNASGWGAFTVRKQFMVIISTTALTSRYSMRLTRLSISSSAIRYTLYDQSHVSIRLFTMQGRLIKSLCNSLQPSGSYMILLNAATLSKGLYILSFAAGNETIQKKLLKF